MAKKKAPDPTIQGFQGSERLFHRVRRNNVRNGKPTPSAFSLPDMSVNREKFGDPEEARKGFDKADWGVSAFTVADIPPRESLAHMAQTYRLLPRHVPVPGNHAHSEVRVWRVVEEVFKLITNRKPEDFEEDDPDREEPCDTAEALLDPDFHMRWRKRIALAARMVLPCEEIPAR